VAHFATPKNETLRVYIASKVIILPTILSLKLAGEIKKSDQLAGQRNGLLVKDDILCSTRGVVPLIYFGFLY